MAGKKYITKFYVYVHRKISDNSIFYVGKGCGGRAHSKIGRTDFWHRIVNKYGLKVEIVISNMEEKDALQLEVELIAFYGRKNLCNMTDGGDGCVGRPATERQKFLVASKLKGKKKSAEHIEKMRGSEAIRIINSDGEVFISAKQAARDLNLRGIKATQSAISRCCNGYFVTASGYSWAYYKEGDCPPKKMSRRKRERPVVCSNGMRFTGQNEAARWLIANGKLRANQSEISKVCSGKRLSAYGFKWFYG